MIFVIKKKFNLLKKMNKFADEKYYFADKRKNFLPKNGCRLNFVEKGEVFPLMCGLTWN